MSDYDLVLLHAPSVYDFRQEAILYGPVADFVPAPFVFETYPLGYTALVEYLERGGYRVHLMNLAAHMLDVPDFDAEAAIATLNPIAFAIDFHWLAHAQGALAVAQIVKTFHPETPVILGGSAATYFHRELVDYPQVDYVLRGDSTEDPLLRLMECLSLGRIPDLVPGLTWRTRSGRVVENPLGPPLASLDSLTFGYEQCWLPLSHTHRVDYTVAIGMMARGCTQNCLTCGSSAYACWRLHGRQKPGYRSPELLARDLRDVRRYHTVPVCVPGDITQAGMDYAYRFLQAMRGFPDLVFLDLFGPVPRKFLRDVADALPHFALQISTGSHDTAVRQALGKSYSNEALEQTIADALSLGCERLDLHFAIGLPRQDYDSVMATVAYCDDLLIRFSNRGILRGIGRLQPFIAPVAPFLDPGSLVFGEPQPAGYRLLFHSLEEHRQALLAPSWKYVLNYETEWMTRDDIVRATYDATAAMARLRAKHNLIPSDYAQELEKQVDQAYQLMAEIDRALALNDTDRFQDTLRALKPRIDEVNRAGLCDRHLISSKGIVTRRPVGFGRALRSTRKVWLFFRDWWRRWNGY